MTDNDNKWLNFVETKYTGKTYIYDVLNNYNFKLGIIKWYPNWRRYVFMCESDIILDNNCMKSIINFIDELMTNRKK